MNKMIIIINPAMVTLKPLILDTQLNLEWQEWELSEGTHLRLLNEP